MMTETRARAVARSLWGEDETLYDCNRQGAFWLSCAGHGGLILDTAALSAAEKDKLRPYCDPDQPWLEFEEDVAWSIPAHLLGIGRNDMLARAGFAEDAARIFDRWHNPENPQKKAMDAERKAREERHPDLIVSAINHGDRVHVRVGTADSKVWLVTGYDAARDGYGCPWLSRCTTAVEIDPATHAPIGAGIEAEDEAPRP